MPKNSPLFVEIGQGLSVMVGLPTIADWNNDTRPKNAKKGTFGFNSETNSLEYFNGSNWLGTHMEPLTN